MSAVSTPAHIIRSHSVTPSGRTMRIDLAKDTDREIVYRLRHEVYARELHQHLENAEAVLRDSLDDYNTYLVASVGGEIAGFISITSPSHPRYSIDKYLPREELPFPCDEGLYEIRLLTVVRRFRTRRLAALLMYAAFRWVEARGGTRIMAIGRQEILGLYEKAGLERHGKMIRSGAVSYELMSAPVASIRLGLSRYASLLRRLETAVDWRIGTAFRPPGPCFHGGAFFEAVGDEFDVLDRSREVVNADVLDAWFPPAPGVAAALAEHLPWLLRTSPPTYADGMVRAIARARGVAPECVLAGAGSSDLIYLVLRQWLNPESCALLLDPTYGEYAHVLERIVGCRVDRIVLDRAGGYRLDLAELESRLSHPYDLVVLVNPNSPTGQHVPPEMLEPALRSAPVQTRFWIDETYVDYAGPNASLERFAVGTENMVVCKSMSKVYALSGVRAGYLCAAPALLEEMRALTPPWSVSLIGQVAAVKALRDPDYYAAQYAQTHALRAVLAADLRVETGAEIVSGVANFLLCHLPPDGPDAATAVSRCRADGVFLRDASTMGTRLGCHALRIAVKDAAANRRIVETLSRALRG